MASRAAVLVGLDRFTRKLGKRLSGRRVGIVAHPASVTRELSHAIDLVAASGVRVGAVFAPEHGLSGTEQDLKPVDHEDLSGVPVYSLYGDQLRPTRQMLEGLDALLFDLQDVGSRYYTFISTMLHCMRACAECGVELIVLDRPNPIGGAQIEGNLVESTHLSYVGVHSLPARHGMTVGELAGLFAAELVPRIRLTVIAMTGWRRAMWYDETRRPWILPSPNMPTVETAAVYPGMCLVEGTNLSEGRGTTRPFELFGAPWLDAPRLAGFLRDQNLPGVVFRATRFKPTFNKFAGEVCRGFQLHVTDRRRFRPYRTGVAVVQGACLLHPRDFAWRPPPYEYETEKLPIDILLGSSTLRRSIEAGVALAELEAAWSRDLAAFARRRRPYLLY